MTATAGLDDLVFQLNRLRRAKHVSEFVATEVRARRFSRTLGLLARELTVTNLELRATLFVDSRSGRGQASLAISGRGREELLDAVARAVAEARASVGPAWLLPAPGAPARVRVAAPEIERDPKAFVDQLSAEVTQHAGGAGRLVSGRIAAGLQSVELISSGGLESHYTATDVEVAVGLDLERSRPSVVRRARRRADLLLQPAFERAIADDGVVAAPLEPGRYDVVIAADALAHGEGHGLFHAVAAQAASRAIRLGLSRYRPGQPIAPSPRGERITIYSDGTIDYGVQSAPFDELGAPVRRFPLVRDGVAAGVALGVREAGLVGQVPNGGVRNLDVAPGVSSMDELAATADRPLLRIDQLSWLRASDRGDLACGIASARLGDTAIRGGVLRGDLFELLGRARLAPIAVTRGAYRGPEVIRFDDVSVLP